LASSGVPALDQILAGEGYPDKSTVLVVGPPGIGKEALGYWFTQSGLSKDDFCLYVTRLSVKEVLQDEKGFE
jgi:KaiC/GvpD/RAD55 family RecA-like ATPase